MISPPLQLNNKDLAQMPDNYRSTWLLIFAIGILGACNEKTEPSTPPLFELMDSGYTTVTFNNQLSDTDDFNILEYLYYYNGGGVALGDLDNDGLTDIYFSANQGANKLYRNLGDMKFEDITESAGVRGDGDWSTGVTMADVNGDGYLDIYLSQLGDYKSVKGKNQLFINNGDLSFTDKASEYGLDFQGFSTQASFFDYDNDGDLDMYLLNHAVHTRRSYGRASLRFERDPKSGDRLYRNDSADGTPKFSNITEEAGIYSSHIGYGLSAGVGDFNQDGCLDIYVCNDFHENDYLYINNCDGTFSEKFQEAMGHSSRFSMGNDIADFNNDGLLDLITLDMLPGEEEVLKISAGEESDEVSDIKLQFGYYHQLARNTLQLNRGNGLFSDVALLTETYATDWSWAPLMVDFDNDGLKDIFISNGIVKRPNDLDYINYVTGALPKQNASSQDSIDKILIDLMPTKKVANYLFRNTGEYGFISIGSDWGIGDKSFSNGAAYGDLDNDGDMDLVVNNINEKAFIYRNLSRDNQSSNYLSFSLSGLDDNRFGVGAKLILTAGGVQQYQEMIPTRGFLSSVDQRLLFGLDTNKVADKVTVIWPSGTYQELRNVSANQQIILKQEDAAGNYKFEHIGATGEFVVEDITEASGMDFVHIENNYKDYNKEYLIPHKLSALGPCLAVADVNEDGLDDVFVGGARGQSPAIFLQGSDGTFQSVSQKSLSLDRPYEDVAATFFDSDGDGDQDLYVVSGGNQASGRDFFIRDRLYLNNGEGNFVPTTGAIPDIFANGSCVKAADYDGDGDIDLFLGTRSIPGQYGRKPPSYLLVNDGSGRFSDQSNALAPDFLNIGMVTDAIWLDYDQDADLDLIVVGEWMPISVFENRNRKLVSATEDVGLSQSDGWWNSISGDDFDGDGDLDLVVGNLGHNAKIKANANEPATLYVKDFDNNGRIDPLISFYKEGDNTLFATRDQLIKQIAAVKKKFPSYKDYGNVRGINDVFTEEELQGVEESYAYTFSSAYLENDRGEFRVKDLPIKAQMSTVNKSISWDFDQDGNKDIILGNNFYGAVVNFGRYDAGYGLVLKGDGEGNFNEIEMQDAGLVIKGEVRDMAKVTTANGEEVIILAKNNAPLQVIKSVKKHVIDIEVP